MTGVSQGQMLPLLARLDQSNEESPCRILLCCRTYWAHPKQSRVFQQTRDRTSTNRSQIPRRAIKRKKQKKVLKESQLIASNRALSLRPCFRWGNHRQIQSLGGRGGIQNRSCYRIAIPKQLTGFHSFYRGVDSLSVRNYGEVDLHPQKRNSSLVQPGRKADSPPN